MPEIRFTTTSGRAAIFSRFRNTVPRGLMTVTLGPKMIPRAMPRIMATSSLVSSGVFLYFCHKLIQIPLFFFILQALLLQTEL